VINVSYLLRQKKHIWSFSMQSGAGPALELKKR
jgi:hypothetical protein